MRDTLIEKLAGQIAEMILPPVQNVDGSTTHFGRTLEIECLLVEFAIEVKRASVEGEW